VVLIHERRGEDLRCEEAQVPTPAGRRDAHDSMAVEHRDDSVSELQPRDQGMGTARR
jgi:hypothetical protein